MGGRTYKDAVTTAIYKRTNKKWQSSSRVGMRIRLSGESVLNWDCFPLKIFIP